MTHFTPTYRTKETSRNIRIFIEDNMPIFWQIMKPLMPFIVGLLFLDAVLDAFVLPQEGEHTPQSGIGSLLSSYFYTALVIDWHRVVIHGPENFTPMNPLKPKKHELAFLGMGIVLGIGLFLIMIVAMLPGVFLGPVGIFLSVILALGSVFYFGYKFSFYFPAKAVDNAITFRESFRLTKGYLWKLIATGIRASAKLWLLLLAYILVVFAVMASMAFITSGTGPLFHLVVFLIQLPMALYFQPLLTIIGVTALSNYYMHAMQNKAEAHKEVSTLSVHQINRHD